MTQPGTQGAPSVASMVGDVAADVTRLMRQEVDLARTEIQAEMSKAARGARAVMMGAASLHLFAFLTSAGGVLALSELLAYRVPGLADWSTAIAAGVVAVLWLLIGATLLGSGRRRLRSLDPVPRQTIESLKEDIAWLRKPNA